jgi:hypothetical protein
MSTMSIRPRSSSERGLSAESSAIGNEIRRKRIVPPMTSDAVTGRVLAITVVMGSRWCGDSGSLPWSTTFPTNRAYWWTTEPWVSNCPCCPAR